MLSDDGLRNHLRRDDGGLDVSPIRDEEQQIQPASIDVRLFENILTFNSDAVDHIDPEEDNPLEGVVEKQSIPEDGYIIEPHDFILGSTVERVEIPNDLLGEVQGRSTYGRLGIVIHATAGVLDPGFEGQVTLEISNLGEVPVKLSAGARIGQLLFTPLDSPSEVPYGAERGSKYQGQSGPTMSRVGDDPEFSE